MWHKAPFYFGVEKYGVGVFSSGNVGAGCAAANCHPFNFPLQVAQKSAYCDPDVFGLFRACME